MLTGRRGRNLQQRLTGPPAPPPWDLREVASLDWASFPLRGRASRAAGPHLKLQKTCFTCGFHPPKAPKPCSDRFRNGWPPPPPPPGHARGPEGWFLAEIGRLFLSPRSVSGHFNLGDHELHRRGESSVSRRSLRLFNHPCENRVSTSASSPRFWTNKEGGPAIV